jgi:hypothetical protein
MKRLVPIAFLVVALLMPVVVSAQANSEAALILRVLSYDRNLRRRASERVTVLAVHGGSARECDGLVRALNQLGRAVSVSGMRTRAVLHQWNGESGLASAARSNGASVLYVCPGFEPDIAQISTASRRASLLSISSREADVRAGLTVGIVRRGSATPQLLVNVRAAEAEGARLDAALLRIATVVR